MDPIGRPASIDLPGHTSDHESEEYQHQQSVLRHLDTDERSVSQSDRLDGECVLGNLQTILGTSTYPDIHQIMRARNTNTNKAFSDIWTQMRGLYLKVIDSTENVSWETYKQYLAQNISYTPYLATASITIQIHATWLADAPNDIQHMVPRRPPSSGKTYFVRFVSSFFLSIGQVRNFNRNDSFPLNDCTDKRILVWDEPNYTRENLETIKMLFSGDNTPANVKYENQVVIEKTPLLITTNTDVFPTSEDFNKRMVRYRWTQLPITDEDHKQLYPMALPELFAFYDIH
ncbi:Parvovirus non-structural protein NS1 [Popillia japonica]|uniref:Parvovirus non-structural protein NS1 n=1 Tax=Popillia japonica TaxID=7064 RepID=A0AAW1JUI5_POPJA